jgi:hypothetical protein
MMEANFKLFRRSRLRQQCLLQSRVLTRACVVLLQRCVPVFELVFLLFHHQRFSLEQQNAVAGTRRNMKKKLSGLMIAAHNPQKSHTKSHRREVLGKSDRRPKTVSTLFH